MDALLGSEHPASGHVNGGCLRLRGITRRFGGTTAVDDVSFGVADGELLALVGASGSGKTTTLRITAGYEPADSGTVELDGKDITRLPPQQRDFGMVFQHYALFPHLTVEENVAFGLEARGVARASRLARARAALAGVGLETAGPRAVQSLSGGEQQRVALARALVIEPRVLLLDEPLSNLDPTLRRSTRDELRALLRRQRVTALFVSHDQEDAFAIADRVAVLSRGRLLQLGSPETLYDEPASRTVAEFVGRATLLPATLDGDHADIAVGGVVRRVRVVPGMVRSTAGRAAVLAVLRPESLGFAPLEWADAWPGVVRVRRFAGAAYAYRVQLDHGPEVEVAVADRLADEGDRVAVRVVRESIAVVDP
jgi:ABC-type Fe3+/spermidine/putrescine transport system ATPase subunit